MSSVLAPVPTKPQQEEPNPFRFGWKWERRLRADGTDEEVRLPLTMEDLLHPQWGYKILENTEQERGRRYLNDVFRLRLEDRPQFQSFSDLLILWEKGDSSGHSPDISVFENVPNRDHFRKSLNVAEEGVEPRLFLEWVSPDPHNRQVRDNDVIIKVGEYGRRGVLVYVIVDQERVNEPRTLLGYRNTTTGYAPITPDAQGRIFLEVVNVWLGLRDNRVVCYDGDTGEEIPDFVRMSAARDTAERHAQAEAESRRAAEERVQVAEQRAQLAEQQAREAQARAEAEARFRAELEAQLQALKAKLQGQDGESA